jgi:glutamyl-tRNA synthetase
LANVVDDYLMQITHVIRGEEWLPSAPLHVLLYQSFGWQDAMPQFAHLPLLLKPDGNGKLSKRDADQMGFPIFPLNWTDPKTKELAKGFRESGYLPEALINFLAFLGWNPGTEQEIFSIEQLTEVFTLERIGKAGAKFDIQKAQWFNQQYLRSKSNTELAKQLLNSLKKENISCSEQKAEKVCQAMRERITYPQDIFEHGRFFFTAPILFDESVISKKWNEEAVKVLSAYRDEVKKIEAPSAEIAKTTLDSVAGNLGIGTGKVLQALRVALTGQGSGPDLMLTIEILGSEETVSRLDYALQNIQLKK